jgi:hypothetical protein
MNRLLIAAAVTAALGAATPAVFAETSQTETPTVVAAAAPEGATAQRAAPEQRRFRLPSERVEARLAYVRTALKITDAQQSQWEGFANVLRKHARDMDQRIQQRRAEGPRAGGPRPQSSAIDRLERTQQRMQQRSARLGEVIAAAKPLYASLSPEQKQVADELLSQRGRGGHGGRHHMRHRGMHRGA